MFVSCLFFYVLYLFRFHFCVSLALKLWMLFRVLFNSFHAKLCLDHLFLVTHICDFITLYFMHPLNLNKVIQKHDYSSDWSIRFLYKEKGNLL